MALDPPGFITVADGAFIGNGGPFFAVGTNMYGLMVDKGAFGSDNSIADAMAAIDFHGFRLIRTWAFADGENINGSSMWLQNRPLGMGAEEPSDIDETMFAALDYVLYQAELHNCRVILPIVNGIYQALPNGIYGGSAQYVQWAVEAGEIGVAAQARFYDTPWIEDLLKAQFLRLANRANTFKDGLLYKNDPTIFAWEIANEPRFADSPTEMAAFMGRMATYMRSVDANHLITDGAEGFDDDATGYTDLSGQAWLYDGSQGISFSRNLEHLDFGSVHLYPVPWLITLAEGTTWITDHAAKAAAAGKPLLVGEAGFPVKNATNIQTHLRNWIAGALASGASLLQWDVNPERHVSGPDDHSIQYPYSNETDELEGTELATGAAAALAQSSQEEEEEEEEPPAPTPRRRQTKGTGPAGPATRLPPYPPRVAQTATVAARRPALPGPRSGAAGLAGAPGARRRDGRLA